MESQCHDGAITTDPQFGLRNLLLFVGGASVLLAPVHWFGMYYFVSLVGSLAVLYFCLSAYENRRPALMFVVAGSGLIIGSLIESGPLFINSVFNLVACAICAAIKARGKTMSYALIVSMVAAYGIVFCAGYREYENLNTMLAKYPFVSLEPRLAFERRQPLKDATIVEQPLSKEVLANLEDFEDRNEYVFRALMLHRLHDNTYHQFAIAAGFGNSRMGRFNPSYVELEPRPTITMPLTINYMSLEPTTRELNRVALDVNLDFLDPERTGYVRSRSAVAGFESHGFAKLPDELQGTKDKGEGNRSPRWRVSRLELVSILRDAEPTVYVAKNLPRMDQLDDVVRRPLNDFERKSLPKLVADQDVVFEEQAKGIQMLGAVRASTRCLECHDGKRGKLLGAFSYEIVPLMAAEMTASVN
jgi:hypothetical protein